MKTPPNFLEEEFFEVTRFKLERTPNAHSSTTSPSTMPYKGRVRMWEANETPAGIRTVLFWLPKGQEGNVTAETRDMNQDTYFSTSKMVLFKGLKLITESMKVKQDENSDDVNVPFGKIIKNSVSLSKKRNLYIDFAFNIDANSTFSHPCQSVQIAKGNDLKSFSSADNRIDEIFDMGGKICGYPIYTVNEHYEASFLLFYKKNNDIKITDQLNDLKDYHNSLLDEGSDLKINESAWNKLFIIPLQLPDSSIVNYIIPDSKEGKVRLKAWIQGSKLYSKIGIDRTFDYIDKWETPITLDARIINIPPC